MNPRTWRQRYQTERTSLETRAVERMRKYEDERDAWDAENPDASAEDRRRALDAILKRMTVVAP